MVRRFRILKYRYIFKMKPKDYECNGWRESGCCGASIKWGDICVCCGEHCDTMCDDCDCACDCDRSSVNKKDKFINKQENGRE